MEVILLHPTPDGTEEIRIDGRLSFGRGSEADYRFADDGLSRLHSTVYREGDNIWVVDENSTNGTFVNGEQVRPSGTQLRNGDTISIGNETTLRVKIIEKEVQKNSPVFDNKSKEFAAASSGNSPRSLVNLVAIGAISFAIFVIAISAVLVGAKFLIKEEPVIAQRPFDDDEDEEPLVSNSDNDNKKDDKPSPGVTPKSDKTPKTASTDNTKLTDSPEADQVKTTVSLPSGKKYLELSDSEKRQYLESRASKVAAMIGNRVSGEIPALAIDKIKGFVDGYAKRVNVARMTGCRFGDNLQATYERASKNAPFIIHAFNQEGVDPQIGMYLAMIESEHCVCLQSPTGPLGMFQFTKSTGEAYGLAVFKGASPSNPDERCKPEPAARAAAKYMKFLTGRYGTGPSSVPLAIGSYNSGEGGLSKNLKVALESNEGLPRDFWALIANGDKLSKQFQSENFKYVPKYFAAAIIGENPQDFGLNLQSLSTYTK